MKLNDLILPNITDEDIVWAARLMGLKNPETAFDGARSGVLKDLSSIDVKACPGSGKTTLLVAKLAILANYWSSDTQGICVMSHTNVARQEIEKKLGNTSEGQRLLSYPHYIGTIHGFVNTYIALPWLRSKGVSISAVQDDVTLHKRWACLPDWIKNVPEERRIRIDHLRACSVEGAPFSIRCGRGVLGKETPTFLALERVIKETMRAGFYTYDEVFLFAQEALGIDGVIDNVRARFPVCFIDEAQDCSETQSQIIGKIFPQDSIALIRQRFGDGNQAIYNSYEDGGAETDKFPVDDDKKVKEVSDSLRLNNRIAALADPLGLVPYSMKGEGGVLDSPPDNVIFLYDDTSTAKVLPAYGDLILSTFSDKLLAQSDGIVCHAVGQVHKVKDKLCVRDYWSSYNPEHTVAEPSPQSMSEYVALAMDKVAQSGEVCDALNLIAKGIVRHLQMRLKTFTFPQTQYPHRRLIDLLVERGEDHAGYIRWLASVVSGVKLSEEKWNVDIKPCIAKWANAVAGEDVSGACQFMEWQEEQIAATAVSSCDPTNVYTHENADRTVKIKLGSIHSVKGQNHLSTLVLDTLWQGRNEKTNLAYLIDWLTGESRGEPESGGYNVTRLKCHYVAMTRASDLLCLAIHTKHVNSSVRSKLEAVGWKIIEV